VSQKDLDKHDQDERANVVPPPLPPLNSQPQVAVPLFSVPPAPAAVPPPVVTVAKTEPVLPTVEPQLPGRTDPYRGESPMMRNWRICFLITFLTPALTAPRAAADEEVKADTLKLIQSQLAQMDAALKKNFAQYNKNFEDINANSKFVHDELKETQLKLQKAISSINRLQDDVTLLRSDVDVLKKRDIALYPPGNGNGLDDIKARLRDIENGLARLNTQPRVAFSPPAAARSGRVVLVNGYASDVLFTINGQNHRVVPGGTMTLEVPAGGLSYEAMIDFWGVIRRTNTTLGANETVTLTAR
jgi:hypothetical protein